MNRLSFTDQEFRDMNMETSGPEYGEYESCRFINCDFSNADLSRFTFMDSTFADCNLSNALLEGTSFQHVAFRDCKLLGLQFDTCKPFNFGISFDNCMLNHSIFYQLDLRKSQFNGCQMQGTDFGEAKLNKIQMTACDLYEAIFDRTDLSGADLRESYQFRIDPDQNIITGASFSRDGLPGLLSKYNIHIE